MMPTTNFQVDVFQEDGEIKHATVKDTQDPARFKPLTVTVRETDSIHVKGQTLISNAFENLIENPGSFHGIVSVTWEMQTFTDPETGTEYQRPVEQDTIIVAS